MATRIYERPASTIPNERIYKQMQDQSDRILQDFRNQLTREIVRQSGGIAQTADNFIDTGTLDSSAISLEDFSSLLPVALQYLARPIAHTTVQQTSRSVAAAQQFRLSQSQAAAQASAALATAQKNA